MSSQHNSRYQIFKTSTRALRLSMPKIPTFQAVWRKISSWQYDRYPVPKSKSSVVAVWLLLDIKLYCIFGMLPATTHNFKLSPCSEIKKGILVLKEWCAQWTIAGIHISNP